VKEGEILLHKNRQAQEMFFICEGILKILVTNSKGVDIVYFFRSENQLCTLLDSFINHIIAEQSVVAACNATLITFTRAQFSTICNSVPFFNDMIHKIMQQELINKVKIRSEYLGEDATTRYHNFLSRQPEIATRVSMQDIASYLEITPQSFSRIRRNV